MHVSWQKQLQSMHKHTCNHLSSPNLTISQDNMKTNVVVVYCMLCALFPCFSVAADCTLPTTNILESLLQDLTTEGGDQQTVSIESNPFYTCQVQGTTIGTYQQLSVIVQYTVDEDGSIIMSRQFELMCSQGTGWESVLDSLTTPPLNFVTIGLRTYCTACSRFAGNDNHCHSES